MCCLWTAPCLKTDDPFVEADIDLSLFSDPVGLITHQERKCSTDPIQPILGPVIDNTCSKVCQKCLKSLQKKKVPVEALANGNWIGDVPPELQGLLFVEKMLIACVSHNQCIIKVHKSGQWKMKANAVFFSVPMPKVYKALPPAVDELDDVLAYIYIGTVKLTEQDHKRTPFLVRRNKVAKALKWLKLNHYDYADLEISQANLEQYPESGPPVVIDYRQAPQQPDAETLPVTQDPDDDGVEEGDCPFVIHTLTASQYMSKDIKQLKAIATDYITSGGKVLAIGNSEVPESIYDNPQLYPQIFPWLFPYGLGGIGHRDGFEPLSDARRKRMLLLYHDKRFQLEALFPLVAFNHQQIKNSVKGGFLTSNRGDFQRIADRLMDTDETVLSNLILRLQDENNSQPFTVEEKQCMQIINDLDHVACYVQGSTTNRKYQRNEIWSLMSYLGAPSWFITFAPKDTWHPLALYYAATDTTIYPKLLTSTGDGWRLISNNPVASARFFNHVVKLFIQHVLGVGSDHLGLWGKTSGYYGTVEQQGRLTLHLHMLLWLEKSLTPQEIRDKILDPESTF